MASERSNQDSACALWCSWVATMPSTLRAGGYVGWYSSAFSALARAASRLPAVPWYCPMVVQSCALVGSRPVATFAQCSAVVRSADGLLLVSAKYAAPSSVAGSGHSPINELAVEALERELLYSLFTASALADSYEMSPITKRRAPMAARTARTTPAGSAHRGRPWGVAGADRSASARCSAALEPSWRAAPPRAMKASGVMTTFNGSASSMAP